MFKEAMDVDMFLNTLKKCLRTKIKQMQKRNRRNFSERYTVKVTCEVTDRRNDILYVGSMKVKTEYMDTNEEMMSIISFQGVRYE